MKLEAGASSHTQVFLLEELRASGMSLSGGLNCHLFQKLMLFHIQLTGAIGREFFGSKEGLIDKFYLRRLRDYVEDAIEARYGIRIMLGFGERSEIRVVKGELPVPIDQVKRFLVGSIEDYITRHPVVRFR